MKTKADGVTQSRKVAKVAKRLNRRLRKMARTLDAVAVKVEQFGERVARFRTRLESLRLALKVVALCVAACVLTGCASTDGRMHTLVTGAQVEKAYRLAGEQGYVRQQVDGDGRWMNIIQLEGVGLGPKSLLALQGPELLDAQLKQQQVFRTLGRTDAQMVQTFNSRGVVWGQLADGAIGSALAAGLIAGIAALADGGDSGGGSSDSAGKGGQQATGTTINQISGSPGASINNDGGEGGQTGGGSGGSGAATK